MLSARMCHHDCVGDELGRVEEYKVGGKLPRRGARLVKMEAKQRWQASMMHSSCRPRGYPSPGRSNCAVDAL
jgi:hypothetical protein